MHDGIDPLKEPTLFVFDLDGTLVHRNEKGEAGVPKGLQQSLQDLALRYHLVVATGRRLRTAQTVLAELPALSYLICHNGLLIAEPPDRILEKRLFESSVAVRVAELLRSIGLPAIFVLDGSQDEVDFACLETDYRRFSGLLEVEEKVSRGLRRFRTMEEMLPFVEGSLIEVASVESYLELLEAQNKLKTLLPESVRAIVVKNVGYRSVSVMEIIPQSVSKWSGVEFVSKRLGVDQIIAIGDDENDIEMIREAHIGVVMAHAEAHIREQGQHLVEGPLGLEDYLRKEWLR